MRGITVMGSVLYILLFMGISTIFAQPVEFKKLHGTANDIAAMHGSVYFVGTDKVHGGFNIFGGRLGSPGLWHPIKGGAVRISAGNLNPWVVNDANEIYRFDGPSGVFKKLPGSARDIGIGYDGTVWVIGTTPVKGGFSIHRWDQDKQNWNAVKGGGIRISVDPIGLPWVVNDANEIYRLDSSGVLKKLPGSAYDIGIGGEGSVYVVGTNQVKGGFGIYRWNKDKQNWDAIPGGATNICVDDIGRPWVVNDRNEIYQGTNDPKLPGEKGTFPGE